MIQALERAKLSPALTAGKTLAQIAIVFAVYFIAGKLGQAFTSVRSGNLGPVWPAFGIALAAILLFGYRVWVGVAASAFLIALLSPAPAVTAAGQAAGATLAAVCGAYVLQRMNFQRRLSRLQDILALMALGAFGSAMISATIGVGFLYGSGIQSYAGLGRAWLIYWLGDATGALLITPLVLTFPDLFRNRSWGRRAELLGLLLLLTITSYGAFSDFVLIRLKLHVVAFAVLPFVMWAAIRFGMSGATLANLVVATLATTATAFGSGPFSQGTAFANAVSLDAFYAVLATSGMVLAALISERERAQSERERLVSQQASMAMRLRLATIVESSDDAIIGTDMDGTITDWNKGAENLYGYSAGESIGQSIFLLVPRDRANLCRQIMDRVVQGEPVRHYETKRLKKDGSTIDVSLTASPTLSPDGRLIGLSSIERDITERKRQEMILRDNEERFRLAAHAGKMFAYEWDATTDVIVRSAESTNILGIDQATRLSGEQALSRVHPDDKERLAAAFAALTPNRPYLRISYRILRPDGSLIWVDRHSVAHFDEQGKIQRIVGMIADITERKRAEEALANARNRLIDAQEQERSRIARELHDDIGQRLTLLTVELEQLRRGTLDLPTSVAGRLETLRSQAQEMAADVQSMSRELHSAKLEYLGIASATQGFCRDFAEKQHVEVDCQTSDLPNHNVVSPDVSLCLFRVLQEALHNSLKHSGVGRFTVRLWAVPEGIHLTVSDAGAGFDSEEARERQGLGLISMQERLKLVNGTLSIESQPHHGTTIHAVVPLGSVRDSLRAAG